MEIDKNKRQINIFINYLMCTLIVYFLYHIFAGDYGIVSFVLSKNTLNEKQKIMQSIEKDIEFRKSKIGRMKGEYVDADILDEEIRRKFGYGKDNEIVVYSKDLERED